MENLPELQEMQEAVNQVYECNSAQYRKYEALSKVMSAMNLACHLKIFKPDFVHVDEHLFDLFNTLGEKQYNGGHPTRSITYSSGSFICNYVEESVLEIYRQIYERTLKVFYEDHVFQLRDKFKDNDAVVREKINESAGATINGLTFLATEIQTHATHMDALPVDKDTNLADAYTIADDEKLIPKTFEGFLNVFGLTFEEASHLIRTIPLSSTLELDNQVPEGYLPHKWRVVPHPNIAEVVSDLTESSDE